MLPEMKKLIKLNKEVFLQYVLIFFKIFKYLVLITNKLIKLIESIYYLT